MKTDFKDQPRTFQQGANGQITITDHGKVYLEDDEMISFVTPDGREHDFTAKNWGFYATPSVNSRLKDQGFKTALVKNTNNQHYIMVVDEEKLSMFQEYLDMEANEVVQWLDEIELY